MAITGAIFNSLIYGDVNSADYGVYISGNAVFNAPQRSVELVSVPGRNGSIAIDQGHFENIEVEYPAGMFGDDKTDFRQRLSDFRNAIMSKKGYQRLSDTYHPDEYRTGMYVEGLEVEPTHYSEAGQFTLKFNCKPQRYLTSGEEEIDVTDWSDVKTLSGESVTFDDGDTSKGFQSIKTVFNPSQDGTPWKSEVKSAPYLFRQSLGGTVDHEYNSESDAIVGGTVAWNQLVANSGSVSVTVPSGHKYYSSIGGTKAIAISNGSAISATGGTDNIVDLTALFGSSIADYLYSLEQTTAGAGVAKLKEWGFDIDSYHAYQSGSLESVNVAAHETVGFNQWDEEWESGAYDPSTGAKIENANAFRSKNYIPVLPKTGYYFYTNLSVSGSTSRVFYYDANYNYLGRANVGNTAFVTMDDACYMTFRIAVAHSDSDKVCINISSDRNGEYEPYVKHSYPLDSDLTLRGIPKLDSSNNLYYDGDIYEPSGAVTRKYGIVDLGTLDWEVSTNTFLARNAIDSAIRTASQIGQGFLCSKYPPSTSWSLPTDKTMAIYQTQVRIKDLAYSDASSFRNAMVGVYLVYELATETTETADPYTAIQDVSPYGTEQYIDYGVSQGTRDIAVPVGHQTRYIERVPIEGKTQIKTYVSPTNSVEDATIYTTNLNGIKYGGTLDVISGKLDKTHECIGYTGQTINEPWLSDCDEYQQGATPTYGATVVYELTTPTRVSLTAQAVAMLNGTNVIWADADSVEVKYGFEPGTLYNPTRFDAQPLLEVEGYGDIEFNGYKIELENGGRYGYVTLIEEETKERVGTSNHEAISLTYPLDLKIFNTGDEFWSHIQPTFWFTTSTEDMSDNMVSCSGIIEPEAYVFRSGSRGTGFLAIPTNDQNGFVKGTSRTDTGDLVISIYGVHQADFSATAHATLAKIYDAEASTLTLTASIDISDMQGTESMQNSRIEAHVGATGLSTRTILGNPTYIDCELGEAYRYLDGEVASLNKYIDLGSDLPVLAPGVNEVTYPSSVRGLLIKPNWWKI